MERVLCTYDDNFLVIASRGIEHAGIAFAQHDKTSIGDWVREVRALYARVNAEEARGQIFFIRHG
jgi:hypothetical protein